ncbi:MAG: cell wall hydrolase [Lachnospiraceae bacterium]|nr:cell wall hydrolase [Lachnospiraceae bacterium]
MSKRTKLKLKNFRLYIIKYILNSKYIVRNLIVATVFMALVVVVMGIAIVFDTDDTKNVQTNDKQLVIYMNNTTNLNTSSFSTLTLSMDQTSDVAQVQPNDSEMVSNAPSEFDGKFVVIAEGVNVRAEASTDSAIIGSLTYGNVGEIISSDGEWIYFTSGEVTGYVKAEFVVTGKEAEQYVTPGSEYTTAIPFTTEEEDTNDKPEETTEAPAEETTEAPVVEDPVEDTTEAPVVEEPVETVPTDNQVSVETTYRTPITLTPEEINLIASIVTLECGYEPYEGQLAVANVILNRLESGIWGSTVSEVIYAPYQFSTASASNLSYYLENGAKESCVQAVNEALAGTNNIGSYMSFRPTYAADYSSYSAYTTIGNHVFFK